MDFPSDKNGVPLDVEAPASGFTCRNAQACGLASAKTAVGQYDHWLATIANTLPDERRPSQLEESKDEHPEHHRR